MFSAKHSPRDGRHTSIRFAIRTQLSAIRLTLVASGIAVTLNLLFGLMAAWAISRFSFKGKNLLISLIDLPLAVSPVVSGLIFVLLVRTARLVRKLVGRSQYPHPLRGSGRLCLATIFVTFPFVARELIPFMQAQGSDEEEAALVLGASPWKTFYSITLPNIRWSLLYGVILCSARAMGEFGAVSVVSGHIRGETNTLPLHVEILYNEYNFAAAFSVASLLSLVALVTLAAKKMIEEKAAIRGGQA